MKTELMQYDRKMAEELWLELVKLHERFKVCQWFIVHEYPLNMKPIPRYVRLVMRGIIPISVVRRISKWELDEWRLGVFGGNYTAVKYKIRRSF